MLGLILWLPTRVLKRALEPVAEMLDSLAENAERAVAVALEEWEH